MPSNHLILCCPLLLPPSIFPSIRVFSSKSALHLKWPKYWSFSFSMSPSNDYSGLISFRIDWLPSEGRRPVKGRPTSVTEQVPATQPCLAACGTRRQRVSGGATGAGMSSHGLRGCLSNSTGCMTHNSQARESCRWAAHGQHLPHTGHLSGCVSVLTPGGASCQGGWGHLALSSMV